MKVTTPLAAVMAVVPPSVPPVPDAMLTVTCVVLSEVTTLPLASLISTTGCVPSVEPLTPPAGCVVISSVVALPGVTVIDEALAEYRPVAANCRTYYSPTVPASVRSVKVTTPLAAVMAVVPPSVPPVPDAIDTVTCVVLSPVTTLS